MHHEIDKLKLERRKLQREVFWYPLAIATALIAGIATVLTLVFKVAGLMP